MLPAYAGMILWRLPRLDHVGGAPRIRGDDPSITPHSLRRTLCSPHTRG